jgi:hypothetical protein
MAVALFYLPVSLTTGSVLVRCRPLSSSSSSSSVIVRRSRHSPSSIINAKKCEKIKVKVMLTYCNIPVHTRNTVVRVRGMPL